VSDFDVVKGDEFVVVGTSEETIEMLQGKRILIVDDEPDVLETLEELLDMCYIDSASSFETAAKFLDKNTYDTAILDIMGVDGYALLKLANQKNIPAIMLTAHALSSDNLVKSIQEGADSYIPKDKIADIDTYVAEVLNSRKSGTKKSGSWFGRLKPYFDKKFGPQWQDKDDVFWRDFNQTFATTSGEMQDVL
jgi:CheY-like chemotaxis protein